MALFDSEAQSVSNWAAVVQAGSLAPAPIASTSNLASVLLQGAAEQRNLSQNGWFDVEFINFSAETWQFINITEGDIRTGLRQGTHEVGKLLYTFGATKENFAFSDPVDDVKRIKKKIIHYLRPVTEEEILKVLTTAGVFVYENKTANRSLSEHYSYIKKQGQGGGRLDFSFSPLGLNQIAEMGVDPLSGAEVTPFLFYLEGVAYNWFNFGNFMFGAAGAALGFAERELLFGADYNSLVNADKNGYPAQFDSDDDQSAISAGYQYASARHYKSRVIRKWGEPRQP